MNKWVPCHHRWCFYVSVFFSRLLELQRAHNGPTRCLIEKLRMFLVDWESVNEPLEEGEGNAERWNLYHFQTTRKEKHRRDVKLFKNHKSSSSLPLLILFYAALTQKWWQKPNTQNTHSTEDETLYSEDYSAFFGSWAANKTKLSRVGVESLFSFN